MAIRLIVVVFTYRDLPDADKHYEAFGWEMGWIARALASGHGFSSPYYPWSGPTAIMAPLYPGLLSLVFRALRHLFPHFGVCHSHHQQHPLDAYVHSCLFQRQILPWPARRQGCRLGLGSLSLRHLLFRQPGLGVRADRPALHHLLLHRSAHSPFRKTAGVDRLWRALRNHRALQRLRHVHAAFSARLCPLSGAQGGQALGAQRRARPAHVLRSCSPRGPSATIARSASIVPIRDNIWLEIYAGRFRQSVSTTTPRRPPAAAVVSGRQPRRSCRNIWPWAKWPIWRK